MDVADYKERYHAEMYRAEMYRAEMYHAEMHHADAACFLQPSLLYLFPANNIMDC